MTPTAHLRFVARKVGMAPTIVLQQWWTWGKPLGTSDVYPSPDGSKGEWRDVPLETA